MTRVTRGSQLAKSVEDLSTDELAARPRRTESLKLRVTEEQKNDLQEIADDLEMTLSELVVQIVEHALPKLRQGQPRRKR